MYIPEPMCQRNIFILMLCILMNNTDLFDLISGTFLQSLPELVTSPKGHSLSPRSCPPAVSAHSERFGYYNKTEKAT